MSEQHIQKTMTRCRHFTGLMRDTCEAGVRYADVKDTTTRPIRLPCLSDEGCLTTCEKASFPTREEAETEEREFEAMVNRLNIARAAIVRHTGGKRGVGGDISCPNCEGGTLRFSVSGYNGHIHARCSTEGCATWME
jgi:hypothetical protein